MHRISVFLALCGLLTALAYAQQQDGYPRELKHLRRETAETFLDTDGIHTTRMYTRSRFYKQGASYERADISIVEDAHDGFTRAVSAGPYTYRYDPNDQDKGWRFERGEYYADFLPAGDRTGETSITEPRIYGVKEIVVLTADSDDIVSWNVMTNAVAGLEGRALVFRDSTGAYLFRTIPASAVDSLGTDVEVSVSFDDTTLTYELHPDGYVTRPIYLDPSVTTEDTDVKTGYLATVDLDYSNARNRETADIPDDANIAIWVGQRKSTGDNKNRIYRSSLVFDTSDLPGYITIDSVKVVLVTNYDGTDVDFDMKLVEPTFTGDWSKSWFNDFSGWVSSGTYSVTALSNTINSSTCCSVGDTCRFTLNAAGIEAVDIGGETAFMLLSLEDINESYPGNDIQERLGFEEDSPYLEVWYTYVVFPPENFTMTAVDTATIACSWDDMSCNEECFYIIDQADSTVIDSLSADATADTLSGLDPNMLYTWVVVADSAGIRGYSNPDSRYTLLSPPEHHDIIIMPISSDTLRVTVDEPANATVDSTAMEVSPVSGYGTDGSGWLNGTYTYLDGGMHPDSVYVYRVRYRNGDGDSTAWSPPLTYAMNGLETLVIYLDGDAYDDYNVEFGEGRTDSTVVRVGASDAGDRLDGFLSFELPWHVRKGGVDSLFLSMTRTAEESSGEPVIAVYGIPSEDIDPVESLDLGAQDSTGVSICWTISSGANNKSSPSLRQHLRAWQDLALGKDYSYGFGLRLDDNGQANGVRAVFADASHPSYNNDTKLTIYYTPGAPDTLDGGPEDFTITVISPDTLRADWTDGAASEYGYVLCNLADSTVVTGVDTLDENTTSVFVGGLTPNTVYEWFVKAFTVFDNALSSQSSGRTLARMPGTTAVEALSDTTIRFVLDPADNPPWTEFAVQDSLTGMYVDGTAEPDTLREGPPGDWSWKTHTEWGAALGDTLAGLHPDSLYVIRAKARSDD